MTPADPKCPWCLGSGETPALVVHPEDETTHLEYVACTCTKPAKFPWFAVLCGLVLLASITLTLAMCIPPTVRP